MKKNQCGLTMPKLYFVILILLFIWAVIAWWSANRLSFTAHREKKSPSGRKNPGYARTRNILNMLAPASGSAEYCDLSFTSDMENYKCLVPISASPSYSASIRLLTRSEFNYLRLLDAYGSHAFAMFPNDQEDIVWAGRRFNNLHEIYNALIVAKACGRMVVLPRRLSEGSTSVKINGLTSFFDCVDFRRGDDERSRTWWEGVSQEDQMKFCDVSVTAEMESQETSRYYRNRGKSMFTGQNTAKFDAVRAEAKRYALAYWGMASKGSYRCRPCEERSSQKVVAHVRSGDVFDSSISSDTTGHKGQPPLNFYVQAILHSGANEVTVIAEDWSNPILSALKEFDWDGKKSQIKLDFRVGEDYEEDLRLMFCADVVVIGNTSIAASLPFWPNLKAGYIGRTVDIDGVVTPHESKPLVTIPLPCERCETIDEPWLQPLFKEMGIRAKIFGYVAFEDYEPFQNWRVSRDQVDQMLTYNRGTLVAMN